MKHGLFVVFRLWRYFSLYFLKPFDAVNDTLTASLLSRLDWSGELVEIGSGDGVFSYIMHGGSFPLGFDRYLLTDLSRQDIYDTHRAEVLPRSGKLFFPHVRLAIDAKLSHVEKIREIGFARAAVCASYEQLPVPSASAEAVFYYIPHGLKDHGQAMREAHRILQPGGRMLILLYDAAFRNAFICHRLSRLLPGRLGGYFERLDNGRHAEITNLSATPAEWDTFFARHGFRVRARHAGLSTVAWMAYDVQTRPLLRFLIRLFNAMPGGLRRILKAIWMLAWFPVLLLFYFLFSNEYLVLARDNCYLAYELEKVAGDEVLVA